MNRHITGMQLPSESTPGPQTYYPCKPVRRSSAVSFTTEKRKSVEHSCHSEVGPQTYSPQFEVRHRRPRAATFPTASTKEFLPNSSPGPQAYCPCPPLKRAPSVGFGRAGLSREYGGNKSRLRNKKLTEPKTSNLSIIAAPTQKVFDTKRAKAIMKNIRPTRRRLRSPTSPENQPPTKSFKPSSPPERVNIINSNRIQPIRRYGIKLRSHLAHARKREIIQMSKQEGSALPRL